jgi:hypothetical protein
MEGPGKVSTANEWHSPPKLISLPVLRKIHSTRVSRMTNWQNWLN